MWKDYFTFTRTERNGMFILLSVVVVLSIVRFFLSSFIEPPKMDNSKFISEIDAFENSKQIDNYTKPNNFLSQYDTINLFNFNPNTINDIQWQSLGLSEKQIKIINNYLAKGGHFYDKDDFRNIYGISDAQADILIPFIKISEEEYIAQSTQKLEQQLFRFDPNQTTDTDFAKLGLSAFNIRILRNYLNKGGFFAKPNDFKKIYGIDSTLFLQLEPYLYFENKNLWDSVKAKSNSINKFSLININTADTAKLRRLPNIGVVFANRIIKYRDKLGGFAHKEQLLEVYGLMNDRYLKIKDLIFIDASVIKIISINFAGKDELNKHPYLSYDQANAIVKYRKRNGNYINIDQLFENNIIDENTFMKVKVYLRVN